VGVAAIPVGSNEKTGLYLTVSSVNDPETVLINPQPSSFRMAQPKTRNGHWKKFTGSGETGDERVPFNQKS
jgi:hypothetical protein